MARLPGDEEYAGSDDARPTPTPPVRRHTRRLEDKLLVAFHHACDVSDIEVARHILQILELMLARKPPQPDPNRRRNLEGLVAAHERLWNLRHREN
jgi:hypothetical protein